MVGYALMSVLNYTIFRAHVSQRSIIILSRTEKYMWGSFFESVKIRKDHYGPIKEMNWSELNCGKVCCLHGYQLRWTLCCLWDI